jgi:2'-5' RNA ligase
MAADNLYFIAILCPTRVDIRINEFKLWMKDQFGCKVALKSPAHITLVPPFRLNPEQEPKLHDLLRFFSPVAKKIEVVLNGFGHFNKRVLFVNVKHNPLLASLKEETEVYFRDALGQVITIESREFNPHVTIANRDLSETAFEKSWPHFSGIPFKDTFPVTSVNLLKIIDGKWQSIACSYL